MLVQLINKVVGLGLFLIIEREKKEMDTELMAGRFARKEDFAYLCSRDEKCAYKS